MTHTVVETLIADARCDESEPLARALLAMDALPIPWAWEGCFGVRANGEVVYVDDDGKPKAIESFDNAQECVLGTLVYAARRNPALTCLLPRKPGDAVACRDCEATGVYPKT